MLHSDEDDPFSCVRLDKALNEMPFERNCYWRLVWRNLPRTGQSRLGPL